MNTPRLLDSFTGRLRLEGTLTTRTGLHIGAGGSGNPLGTDSPVVRDAAGQPFIPGASLKGVLRSAAEALFRNANLPLTDGGKLWTCDIFGPEKDKCVSHERLKKIREEIKDSEGTSQDVARAVWKESCTVCRLFGSLAMASRVRFPDLPLAGPLPAFEIRNGVGIDRDKELAVAGVLYDFEAVPPETEFRLTVIFDNYHDAEVGLVLYLLDQLHQGNLALGGKGSRGLGLVRVRWGDVVESRLETGNPFASMLSEDRLLGAIEGEPQADAAEEPERPLPTTGNPEDWRTLGEILLALPVIDKGSLGQEAAKAGLSKKELSDRLGLGLPPKKHRQVWNRVLDAFVEHRWITALDEGYALAGQEQAEAEASRADGLDPQLQQQQQKLFDRFTYAMHELWEEGQRCSASN